MAHELHLVDGQAAMMYVGQVPWHGLGHALDKPPTAEEGIRSAKLDWRVGKKPMYAVADGIYHAVPGQYAVVREDLWDSEDCPIFATVSNTYVPLQNAEAFGFFDGLIEQNTATYETAGALGQGERVWVLAKLKGDFAVAGVDELKQYVLLANGHNAATSVRVLLTPVRVVCQNTLNWALSDAKIEFRVSHGPQMHRKLDLAAQQLTRIIEQYSLLHSRFDSMARRQMVHRDLPNYLETVFPLPSQGRFTDRNFEKAVDEVNVTRKKCERLFEEGLGNGDPVIRGSLWAAYNGVIQWTDHQAPYKNRFHRFNSLFFGEGSRVKSRALASALRLIGGDTIANEIDGESGLN